MRDEALIIPLAGIMLPLILVPTIMTLKFKARKRDYEHQERMRALETGQTLPQHGNWPAALVCAAIGAGVPATAFFFTWLASMTSSTPYEDMWAPPTFVGLAGVIAGTKLALRLLGRNSSTTPLDTLTQQKNLHADPDAFDVVGRRG